MFDYDSWLESPYTSPDEGHEHNCYDCDGTGMLWIDDDNDYSETEVCTSCEDGVVYCWDSECYEPPERDDDGDY